MRPHQRRAHWHHVWVGPFDSDDRHLDLRWYPATHVAGEPLDEAVIRTVS